MCISTAVGGALRTVVSRIYLSPPDVGDTERHMLLEAFDSNWIAPLGPNVDAFEREMADYLGVAGAAALSSGTAALHLALIALGVGAGDEVIVPTLTFAATANAVLYVGARPAFIDSDAATWNIDPALLADELEARSRRGRLPAAVIAVDLYGRCADWDATLAACSRYDIPVVDDAAEALGASYRGRQAGTFGACGVLSFNGNKIMTTGGGGMLVSDQRELTDRARHLATQARDPAPHYAHSEIGFNYRLSNLLAAVGRGQVRRLSSMVSRRCEINARYRRELSGVPGLDFMPSQPRVAPNYWLTVVTLDAHEYGASPEDVRKQLEHLDIEARPAWKPMHLQPVFAGLPVRGGTVAEEIFRTGLCLPSGSSMTDDDVDRVAEAVRRARP
jgi:dTDP-4-amino-4,6-dideoxygalactose transaminase